MPSNESNCQAESDQHAAPSSYVHMFPGVFPDRIYLDKANNVPQKARVIKISDASLHRDKNFDRAALSRGEIVYKRCCQFPDRRQTRRFNLRQCSTFRVGLV